ncbi:MAG: SCO family protein [Candidatus Acidiferrales bacterium]
MRNPKKHLLLSGILVVLGIVAVASIAFVTLRERAGLRGGGHANSVMATPASNMDVDPGTTAGDTPAPNFQLRDQLGRETSLQQFRGKVVLIAFVDSQCTTICPLTTESMVKALRFLGPAAADVQLLGINANPLALKVSDVAAYTRAHEMQGRWRFLTGSLPQLKKVWRDYHVYVSAINNDIDHQPVMVLVDPGGREHKVYMTQMSYEGVAPQAQVLADDIAHMLPGPPAAAQEVSLKFVQPLRPTATIHLTPVGKRTHTVSIGATHAHLLLFFASWLDQGSSVAAKLGGLDRYADVARRKGWPTPVAVDELTTESSPTSAQEMLAKASTDIRTPVVEDAQGRLGDGYQVEDLPWYSLSSPSGKIIWSHDGWLAPTDLERQVRAALAKNEPGEPTTALTKSPSAADATEKSSAAD